MVIQAFEKAVIGMNEGDSKSVSIPPEHAFGDHRKDLLVDIEKAQLPDHIEPRVGMKLEVRLSDDVTRYFTVANITEDSLTLDGNHPLAGKEIVLKIELVEIL